MQGLTKEQIDYAIENYKFSCRKYQRGMYKKAYIYPIPGEIYEIISEANKEFRIYLKEPDESCRQENLANVIFDTILNKSEIIPIVKIQRTVKAEISNPDKLRPNKDEAVFLIHEIKDLIEEFLEKSKNRIFERDRSAVSSTIKYYLDLKIEKTKEKDEALKSLHKEYELIAEKISEKNREIHKESTEETLKELENYATSLPPEIKKLLPGRITPSPEAISAEIERFISLNCPEKQEKTEK